MDNIVERFLNKIEFDLDDRLNKIRIEKVIVNKETNEWNIKIRCLELIDFKLLYSLVLKCEKGIKGVERINLTFNYSDYKVEDLKNKFNELLNEAITNNPSLTCNVDDYHIEDKFIVFEVLNKMELAVVNDLFKEWIVIFNKIGLGDYYFDAHINEEKRKNLKIELQKNEENQLNIPKKEEKVEDEIILGRDFKGECTSIKNILGPENNVIVEAYVFGYEVINTSKENLKIVTIKISDKTDSIIAKVFTRNQDDLKALNKIKVGSWYRFRGNIKDDLYAKDITYNLTDIKSIPTKDIKRMDNAEVKRVELHAHTMMSQMDGVADVNKLIETASKWGHKALAITDHNVLQAFPDAFNSKKKGDLKIIYGVEMNVIDDNVNIVKNPNDMLLTNQEFVVFDTETTGFNPTNGDQMIEIGAVKIKDGVITDSFDELISPEKELPAKITELTGITKEMLEGKDTEEAVTKRFMEFAGNCPMVAHNASFDLSFIESALKKYNLGEFKNPLLDTMEISRILSPDEKKHSLSALVKRYNVEFDESSHHRADYDAKGTALVFDKMVKLLKRMDINSIRDLQEKVDISEILKFSRPFHMTILTKNQAGLRNLFKIVSYAGTKYLNKTPRILKSELIKYHDGLIFGSGCVNGEIFNEARRKDDSELANLMKFYDYIEVQPPCIGEYLIDTSEFTNIIELENNIKKIIRVAESSNIMVCATGDVHQVDPEDLIYRKIIINQRTPNVGMHPLNRSEIREVPNMFFRTTDEMISDFKFLNDDELVKRIVIDNPNKIADEIEKIQIIKDKLYTPLMENSDEETRNMCYKNAHKMYGDPLPKIVEDRLEKELGGIISNGYSVLYLIAQKLVKKSNDDGYFVGSRGSVGSSFVATMMDITEVNGLPPHYLCPNPECKYSIWEDENGESYALHFASGYDLQDRNCPKCGTKMRKEGQEIPFATFLGFNAEKVPDIDLNFSGDNQADAHNYTKVLFGEDRVYRAGTIGTVADKTAYGFVKGYLEDRGITMRSPEIERLAAGCVGVKRTTGQHPGGIIVIPKCLDKSDPEHTKADVFDFTAYQYPADDPTNAWYTTHFDFHAIHDNVLKLDILGHDDPTMLKYLGDTSKIDIHTIPFDDKEVLGLFSGPEPLGITREDINCFSGTLGIPEFGTNFVIKMLEETKPKTFAELVKISGLSHGTDVWNGNARDLIMENVVPFKDIIGCRDDILNTLLNYGMDPSYAFTISEFVRKGKPSADPEKWSKFVSDLEAAKVPDWFIKSCGKIKYMFPKAHATAYVMMALRVAWFKVHMPLYYYSAFLSIRCDDFDVEAMVKGKDAIKSRIKEILDKGYNATNKETNVLSTLNICLEMVSRGYKFKNIDITRSDAKTFLIDEEDNALLIPFKTLDGLGEQVGNKVVEERKKSPYISIEDLQQRGKINGTTIDKLRNLGVLDSIPESSQLSLF